MNDQGNGTALMLLRLALQWGGGALVTRGLVDDGTWQAVTGAVITLAGAGWSWVARRQIQRAAAAKGMAAVQMAAPTLAQVDAVLARPTP